MSTILLVDPLCGHASLMPWDTLGTVTPSLGLASIAAFLEARGHRVHFVDATIERLGTRALERRLRSLPPANLVGIAATTTTVHNALLAARIARRVFPGVPVVLGGPHPTAMPHEVIVPDEIDFVVRGEGEITLAELAEGREIASIEGLTWKDGEGAHHNPDRPVVADLDTLPMPAFHLLPLHRYFAAPLLLSPARPMSLVTSRGCPGRCTYCFRTFDGPLRFHSARYVVDEIRTLHRDHGIRQILFFDDTFTAHGPRTREICERLIREDLRMRWVCYSRVDTVDPDLLRLMAGAGCYQICFGIEAANPQILAGMRKTMDRERIRRTIRDTKAAGIMARATFMFGFPGETLETMDESVRFAIDLDLDIALFGVVTPYPGTALFDLAVRDGTLKTRDWSMYDRSHAIIELPGLSHARIQRFMAEAHRRFFLRPGYMLRVGRQVIGMQFRPDSTRSRE